LLGETLPLLIELLYDLNCQDLAPFFEENSTLFLGSSDGQQEGFLRKYLKWERAELMGDVSVSVIILLVLGLVYDIREEVQGCRMFPGAGAGV
jgi:hypothetical protein